MRYHIKAWQSAQDKAQWPTCPHAHFSVFQDSEREARQLLAAMLMDYSDPVVLLIGPHGPEIFTKKDPH